MATYYFSDNFGSFGNPNTIVGDDVNNNTAAAQNPTTPWRTIGALGRWFGGGDTSANGIRTALNSLPAGTNLRFVKGGCWAIPQITQIVNLLVTKSQPLTFESYDPAWGATERPWFKINHTPNSTGTGNLGTMFELGSYSNSDAPGAPQTFHGGYTWRGIRFDGLGQDAYWFQDATVPSGEIRGMIGGKAFMFARHAQYITIEDCQIEYFQFGVQMQNPIRFIVIRNNLIQRNCDSGMLGAGTDLLAENNTFFDNNWIRPSGSSGFSHGWYVSGSGADAAGTQRVIIRNNFFDRNSRGGTVNGLGGNLTFHGKYTQVLIEGNTIYQDSSLGGCIGMSLTRAYFQPEFFRNFIVRNNTIVNLAQAIAFSSLVNPIIENNVFYSNQAAAVYGVIGPSDLNGEHAGDDLDTGMKIRNNTVFFTNATAGSVAFRLTNNSGGMGSNVEVTNNIIHFGTAGRDAFDFGAYASFAHIKNNFLSNCNWGNAKTTVTAGQNAVNAAVPGVASGNISGTFTPANPPSSSNGWSVTPASSQTVINAANATYAARLAGKGYLAVSTRDIGAGEFGSTP